MIYLPHRKDGTDLKPGQSGTNYEYDGTGNLTRDRQAGLRISWLPGGKVHLIHDTVRNTFLKFTYDGAGNRIFRDHIKKISVHEEAHKGEYYVRDGSGHILAVYESSSTYSPLSIVTAATGAVASAPDFGAFIVREVASRSSFRPGFIAKAVEALPSWTEQQTGSRPVSFYLERDEELYSRMLFSSADYFDALRDYEWEGGENVFASSLSDAWAEAAPLLAEILSHESEGVALLTHFSSVIPGDRARELWDEADLSYEEDKAAENAVSLFAYVQAHKLEGKISQDMTGIFIADKEASDGVNTRSFYTALIGDDLVFHSPYLRETGGMFEYQLSGILYNHGPRSALSAFFDGWEPARDRFNENTAPDRRLSVVYDSNPPEQISSFVSASGPDLLSEVIAGMADLPALEYAGKVRQHFPMADLSAATVALSLAADTMTLTEHHLYGLSRIGVQGYDTAYRNTYRPDPDAGVVNRLSGVRPWYSGALGDYIEGGYVDPWGHMLSGMSFEHRVRGHRHYEVTDHLGNVLATVLDRRTGQRAGGSGDLYAYWKADVSGVSDYYPGGMLMPGRYQMMNNDTALYRFGSQGQIKDDEVYGLGNLYAFKYRLQDTRINRFWSVDPLAPKYPSLSTYQFAGNTFIWARELEGLEPWYTTEGVNQANVPRTSDGSYDMGAIQPDKYGPYSMDYANSKGYDSYPNVRLPEVEIKVGKNYTSRAGALQADQIVNSGKYYNAAYHPYSLNGPDYVGINLSASFIFGGGASGNVGAGWLKNEGLTITWGTGGGVGLDVGISGTLQWAYSQKGVAASSLKSFVGTDVSAGGQAVIGLTHARDLSYERGNPELGLNWRNYQLGIGAGIQGSTQIGTTWGTSWKQFTTKPKNYSIE